MANILHSRDGLTQGYPLDMDAYGIGIITLIKSFKLIYSDVLQPCYADNAGALGMFGHLEKYFKALKY